MNPCNHVNFDEYFGKCTDCDATRTEVLADQFREELQNVYANMIEAIGLESGDIDPARKAQIDASETILATFVAEWLNERYETEQ